MQNAPAKWAYGVKQEPEGPVFELKPPVVLLDQPVRQVDAEVTYQRLVRQCVTIAASGCRPRSTAPASPR